MTKDRESGLYRSEIQPLTVQPALALEPQEPGSPDQWLRLVIGAGKHDDIDSLKKHDGTEGYSDQQDIAKMSLYNLREKVDFDSLGDSSWAFPTDTVKGGTIPNTSGSLIFRVRAKCPDPTDGSKRYRCTGERDGATADGTDCNWSPVDMTLPLNRVPLVHSEVGKCVRRPGLLRR